MHTYTIKAEFENGRTMYKEVNSDSFHDALMQVDDDFETFYQSGQNNCIHFSIVRGGNA